MLLTFTKIGLYYPMNLVNIYGASYSPDYINPDEIADIKVHLLALPWETKRTARHEYFMSDKELSYSYGTFGPDTPVYSAKPVTDVVQKIMNKLNSDTGAEFNACFLNKYDNEQQHLGWHADDFEGMRADQPISVISFGAEREIWVKKQGDSGKIPFEQRVKLGEGSLFIMPVGYQDTHFHRIPKHDRPCGWRISLTFRSFK